MSSIPLWNRTIFSRWEAWRPGIRSISGSLQKNAFSYFIRKKRYWVAYNYHYSVGVEEVKNQASTYLREMKKISGCSRRPSGGAEIWGPDLPLKSGLAAERERSCERDSRKCSWAMSGKFCRSAPLTCSGHFDGECVGTPFILLTRLRTWNALHCRILQLYSHKFFYWGWYRWSPHKCSQCLNSDTSFLLACQRSHFSCFTSRPLGHS